MKTLEQQLAEADEVCFKYSIKETEKRLWGGVQGKSLRLSEEEIERLDKLEAEASKRHLKRNLDKSL